MVGIPRANGTMRPVTLKWLIALGTAIGIVGGFTSSAVAWIGAKGQSPAARLAVLEVSDSVQADQIATVTELTLMLVAMRCLDADSLQAAQRARVPCARILREQGIRP